MSGEDFHTLHRLVQRFYRLILVDTGNNIRAANWRTAADAADLLVITTTVREDTGTSAAWMIDALQGSNHAGLVANAVTLLHEAGPKTDLQLKDRFARHLGELTGAVVNVPYELSLVDGGRIDYEALSPDGTRAWLHAAATVAERLTAAGPTNGPTRHQVDRQHDSDAPSCRSARRPAVCCSPQGAAPTPPTSPPRRRRRAPRPARPLRSARSRRPRTPQLPAGPSSPPCSAALPPASRKARPPPAQRRTPPRRTPGTCAPLPRRAPSGPPGQQYGGVPPFAETRAYIARIRKLQADYTTGLPAGAGPNPDGSWPAETCSIVPDPSTGRDCVTPRTAALIMQLRAAGYRRIACWDEHAWNPTSDHPLGKACDVTFGPGGVLPPRQKAAGDQLAAQLQASAGRTGVNYLIWYGHIWSVDRADEGWRPYNGGGVYDPGDVTGGHYDHVHVSMY
jgi:hypothetical protein